MSVRSHTISAADITHCGTDATSPVYSLEFDVYRSTTFLVINDENGDRVTHIDINRDDWNELIRHSNRVRRTDKAEDK